MTCYSADACWGASTQKWAFSEHDDTSVPMERCFVDAVGGDTGKPLAISITDRIYKGKLIKDSTDKLIESLQLHVQQHADSLLKILEEPNCDFSVAYTSPSIRSDARFGAQKKS